MGQKISQIDMVSCDNGVSKVYYSVTKGAVTKFEKSVEETIDTFGSNKKLYTAMKVLNYELIR